MSTPPDFRHFCEIEYERLRRALVLHCADEGLAEEFTQEALVRAAQHWGQVREMTNPTGWLWRVAFNVSNSWFRRLAVEHRTSERLAAVDPPASGRIDVADRMDLIRMLSSVPKKARFILIMHYFYGMSFREISEVLDTPESTVKSRAQRALKRLRSEFPSFDQGATHHVR